MTAAGIVFLVALVLIVGGLAAPGHTVKGPFASVVFLALIMAGLILAVGAL